jgi:hypothetical protein
MRKLTLTLLSLIALGACYRGRADVIPPVPNITINLPASDTMMVLPHIAVDSGGVQR